MVIINKLVEITVWATNLTVPASGLTVPDPSNSNARTMFRIGRTLGLHVVATRRHVSNIIRM